MALICISKGFFFYFSFLFGCVELYKVVSENPLESLVPYSDKQAIKIHEET